MTRAETIAFNAGVKTALDHARRAAEAIAAHSKRPLHDGFAAEALLAFADEGVALILPVPAPPTGNDADGRSGSSVSVCL